MTTSKLLRLMTDDEIVQYEDFNRKEFVKSSTQNLTVYFQLNLKLKQQVEIKLRLLDEILNERIPDNKAKQFKDE